MAVKRVLIWPDPLLKKVAEAVSDFGPELQSLIKDISDSMDEEPMAGLCAPQIGVSKRVFICDIDPADNEGNGTNGKEVFVNPEIIHHDGSFTWEEGCMSIPGFRGKVKRSYDITMRYQNEHGEYKERSAFYYLSGCFQHELDHLNGILWVDYQSQIKKSFIKKKMQQLKSLPFDEQPRWRDQN